MRHRILPAGRHLLHAGAGTDSLFALREGSARSYEVAHDGDERTIEYYLPGEPIIANGQAAVARNDHVVALEPVAYCELSLSQLKPMMTKHPDVSLALIGLLADAVTTTRHFFGAIKRTDARSSVTAFLVDTIERRRIRGLAYRRFRLSLRRREIASLLGVTTETVSRALHDLKANNLIEISGKWLQLVDFDGLREAADVRQQTITASTVKTKRNSRLKT